MSIIETITNEYHFWEWLKKSDGYKDNFSLEGAKAIQEYYEQLSDDLGENIEFDPVAWCCEFNEYVDFDEIQLNYNNINTLDELRDNTIVIELDNGRILVGGF